MTNKQKATVLRVIVSAMLLACSYFIPKDALRLCFFGASYLIIGYDILEKSLKNIFRGQIFDENFLMSIATIGAIFLKEYGEAVFVMLFYQVGELFQSIAVGKSRRSIANLMEMSPDFATVIREGSEVTVDPEELKIGECIIVRPGEKIPIDAVVESGISSIDTANLTGEAIPIDVSEGDRVISGCINLNGVLKLRVEKEFSESTVSKILELIENASENKSSSENFISKFAKYYTPFVVACAFLTGVVLPIFIGDFSMWLHRALMFLVISCPCALVISVPLSFFGGIGCASKNGILIKGSNFVETLAKCRIIAFDKTGTLTKGKFSVSEIFAYKETKETILKLAACGEYYSNHPIARSIVSAYNHPIDEAMISNLEERAGRGVVYYLNEERIAVGNKTLMSELEVPTGSEETVGTVVFVAKNNELLGEILIKDELKPSTKKALAMLKKIGVRRQVMLTGDRKSVANAIGAELELTEVYSGLLPDEKVSCLEKILADRPKNGTLCFVGDGVNDAPVLTRADVGIAMGALGSDAAIEAADVVLMDDDLKKVSTAIKLSQKTMKIVKQNIIFALGVKLLVMILGICGAASMWGAVFADVGVSVIAILNSMRALNPKK